MEYNPYNCQRKIIEGKDKEIASLKAECERTYNQMMDTEKDFQKAMWELQEKYDALEDGANNAYGMYREYKDAEEQGLLIKLPCKAGDTVYDIDFKRPTPYMITGFSYGNINNLDEEDEYLGDEIIVYCTGGSISQGFAESEIGKTIFLSYAEAVEILKGNSL